MKFLRVGFLLVLSRALTAQSATNAAEVKFRGWFDAFNSGDRAVYAKFLQANYPDRMTRIDKDLDFRNQMSGYDFRKIEESTATKCLALIQERDSDTILRVTTEVEAAEPHKIVSVALRSIPRPADMAIPRMTDAELGTALKKRIDDGAAKDAFSGSVLIEHNGKVVFSGAAGYSDREAKKPNTLDTRFRMGSMNKMFTATSILQLVQAGKIDLQAPVGKYLPDYPNKDLATKVTIHHLLTHTGGTGDIFGPQFDQHRLELKTLNDYVKLYGSRGLRYEPGAKWEYSNYGFLLLGVIIEHVAGESYYDYVRDHVFKPAGMTGSGSDPEDVDVPNRSKGYLRDGGALALNTDTLPYRGTSAGGGYTTAGDLQKFANAITTHKLLNEKYTDLLITAKVETGDGRKYAYGFFDVMSGGQRSIGHSGGAPGMNGDLQIFPASGYVVIALANIDDAAQRTTSWIINRLSL